MNKISKYPKIKQKYLSLEVALLGVFLREAALELARLPLVFGGDPTSFISSILSFFDALLGDFVSDFFGLFWEPK
jgi:hypothetical protein